MGNYYTNYPEAASDGIETSVDSAIEAPPRAFFSIWHNNGGSFLAAA
ncbi:MAG: hypothetical protein IIC59_11135 [Proteobacteria bacterium]|nr:hypothetical protein [Pseudomonadota bacterium]